MRSDGFTPITNADGLICKKNWQTGEIKDKQLNNIFYNPVQSVYKRRY